MQVNFGGNGSNSSSAQQVHGTNTVHLTEDQLRAALGSPTVHGANRSDMARVISALFTGVASHAATVTAPPVLKSVTLDDLLELTPQEQYTHGLRFLHGEGVAQDYAQAYQCLAQASNVLPAAQFILGNMQAFGMGRERNLPKAISFYEKAAARGNTDAMVALGQCHELGCGVAMDTKKAAQHYETAAQQGHPGAVNRLAMLQQQLGTGEIQILVQAADRGDLQAQYKLAHCYAKGDGVKKDGKKAFELFLKTAQAGLAEAQIEVGACLAHRAGGIRETKDAFEWYRKAALQGSAKGQYHLGECYRLGWGVEKDDTQAGQWFEKAARQGLPEAQYAYGAFANGGLGWIAKAAEQGHALSQSTLGTGMNHAKSLEWLEKAAQQGDAEAVKRIIERYVSGKGVAKDPLKAAQWLEKLMQLTQLQGTNPSAFERDEYDWRSNIAGRYATHLASAYGGPRSFMFSGSWLPAGRAAELGRNFMMGEQGFDKSPQWAFEWHKVAAEAGHPHSQYAVGTMYEAGTGTEKDLVKAFEWYKKVSEVDIDVEVKGSYEDELLGAARFSLGCCYWNGAGVAKDALRGAQLIFASGTQRAAAWLQRTREESGIPEVFSNSRRLPYWLAAAAGDMHAQYRMAGYYAGFFSYNANAVPDLKTAFEWLEKSARQGLKEAQFDLGAYYAQRFGDSEDLVQAFEWYQKAASQGHVQAKIQLGNCYRDGHGVPVNLELANKFYQEAASEPTQSQ